MNSVERTKELCRQKNITIAKLERDCGFGNGYVNSLKRGSFPDDRLKIIASYLDVSSNYLMSGEEDMENIMKDPLMQTIYRIKTAMSDEKFFIFYKALKDLYELEGGEI